MLGMKQNCETLESEYGLGASLSENVERAGYAAMRRAFHDLCVSMSFIGAYDTRRILREKTADDADRIIII